MMDGSVMAWRLALISAFVLTGAAPAAQVKPSPNRALQQTEQQRAAGRDNMARGNYGAAAWAFRQALILDPADEDTRRLLHDALFAQSSERGVRASEAGDWSHARDAFLEALDVRPESREAREQLRRARYQIAFGAAREAESQGRFAEARSALGQCLELFPGDAAAAKLLATVDARMSHFSQGETAVALLRLGDWLKLDRELKNLQVSGADALVVRALAESARGHAEAAERLLASMSDAPLARTAGEYVSSRRRRSYAMEWAAPVGGFYLLLLACGIFLGLRQVRQAEVR